MKKRMLAEVLWEAANRRLSADGDNYLECRSHSCEAVALALDILWTDDWITIQRNRAMRFLQQLGCSTGAVSAFGTYESGIARQGVRYMWLLLAMHVAEDEQISI